MSVIRNIVLLFIFKYYWYFFLFNYLKMVRHFESFFY